MRHGLLLLFSLLLLFTLKGAVIAQEATGYPDAYPDSTAQPQDQPPMTKERIEGTVESIHGQSAAIRTHAGVLVDVDLGPRAFWRQRGYHLGIGVPVRVEAWHSTDDNSPFYAGTIAGPGFSIELTNAEGFPMWVDSDEYGPDWYPTESYFYVYYARPPLYAFGPAAWWYFGPYSHRGPYWAGRHYYDRPYGGHYAARPHGGGYSHGGGRVEARGGRRGH